MKIVFIGDIMGRAGREALEKHLPKVRRELEPDVVIVNGENAANGAGITEKICRQFYAMGVDCITLGNHTWDQREVIPYIARDQKLIRPINYPAGTPGSGTCVFETAGGQKILIVNVMARLFMDAMDDPFAAMAALVENYKMERDVHAIFVDFHGEATSEKMSLGHYLDGRVSAVIGTHTHVPTADWHIMEGGTAFMADAGMSGDYDSVIGVRKDIGIHRFVRKMPGERMTPAKGAGTMCGVYIETDDFTGLAKDIQPIRLGGLLAQTMPVL